MYSTCIFCLQKLGGNDELEVFPTGRRLAFDSLRGRLWVICTSCERWNLVPLEQRWEAVETCEGIFGTIRTTYSTENIGIARTPSGLDLVRVGKPLRRELAYWRYGDQFGRRRRSMLTRGAIGTAGVMGAFAVGGAAGIPAGGLLFGLVWLVPRTLQAIDYLIGLRVVNVLIGEDDQFLFVRHRHLDSLSIERDPTGSEGSWLICGKASGGQWEVSGRDALETAFLLLPALNAGGAGKRAIAAAVDELDQLKQPSDLFGRVVKHTTRIGLNQLPTHTLLALEMAAAEDEERLELEQELKRLETAWRRAEEVAEIADSLLSTPTIDRKMDEIRAANRCPSKLDSGTAEPEDGDHSR